MTKKFLKIVLAITAFVSPLTITESLAAGMGGGPPAPCGGPFPPCAVPLDNGTIALLLAGALYGGIKIYNSFKKNPV